jgi:hypothetical protein
MKAIFFRLKGFPSQVREARWFKISASSRSQYWSSRRSTSATSSWLELADLRYRQGPVEHQGARGAAAQAYMGGDRLALDQGHVLDEQPQDALALPGFDARVLPDRRELLGQVEDAPARLCIKSRARVAAATLIILDRLAIAAQLVLPFCLESVGDEAVVRIDLHIPSPCEFCLVAHSLDMLAPQAIGLGGPRFEFLLNRQGDV